ncbi:MAG: ATP-binding cassette domain-containing protein [Betaproteobacteria bacterium]|nr:ATP-binding cassette domain-containing protein [Betaproteobacteria bacterium]
MRQSTITRIVKVARGGTNIPDRPVSKDLRPLLEVGRFVLPYRGRIAIAAVALLVAASCVLAMGQALREVVDRGFATSDPGALDRSLFILLIVVAILAMATYVRFYSVSWLGERVTADIRRRVFAHVLTQEPTFFETTRTGEVISRLTNDTALLEQVIGTSFSLALRNGVIMVGSIGMMIATSPKLTLLVLVGVPLVMVPILIFGRRVRRLSRETQDHIADVSAYIDETMHEIRTVQAYAHELHDRARFDERIEQSFATALKRIRNRARLVAMVMFLVFGAIGVILWIGGHDVLAGRVTAGDLSAFVFYAVLVAGAVGAISEVIGDLQRAAGATERLMAMLARRPTVQAPMQPIPMPDSRRGRIALEGVTFFYPSRPERPTLTDFSLAVAGGERVALVGPSGAGKSTVFQLLLRFYDPTLGRVLVDGIDARDADPRALRERFALVSQEPVIFAATVVENVRYARPDATDDAVCEACRAAYMLEFVEHLPQGFNTYLGERGVRLSGGERQRLAVARALLADRAILLLDEATSSLDAESESFVQRALDRLMEDRTTVVIAHRLATVKNADRIIVIDGGRIDATGSHAQLIEAGGLYARFAALQLLS